MATTKRVQDVTPYLTLDNCKGAHDWYVNHFGAKVLEVMTPSWDETDKRCIHSSIELPNNAIIFMADRFDFSHKSEKSGNEKEEKHRYIAGKLSLEQLMSVPSSMHLHFPSVEDAQKFWNKATTETSRSKVSMKFEKQFWGEFFGKFHDAFGFEWSVGAAPPSEEPHGHKNKKRSFAESGSTDMKNADNEDMAPSAKKKTISSFF